MKRRCTELGIAFALRQPEQLGWWTGVPVSVGPPLFCQIQAKSITDALRHKPHKATETD